MPKAEVFHPFHFEGEGPADEIVVWPSSYMLVATIPECASLDDAFALTNHIDNAWWENPGVRRNGFMNHRSTSTGDVVKLDGVPYKVLGVGWEQLK